MLRLIDRTWPWPALLTLTLAGVIFLVSLASPPGAASVREARETVEDIASAAGTNDGERLCALMTDELRAKYAARIRGLSCRRFVRSFGLAVAPDAQLRDALRGEPVVAGDRATVDAPSIAVRLVLARVRGDWRLEALEALAAGRPPTASTPAPPAPTTAP